MKVAVKYIISVLLILSGLGRIFSGEILTGLCLIALGVIILPPISDNLKQKLSFWQNRTVRYVSYVGLFIVAGIFLENKEGKEVEDNINKSIDRQEIIIDFIKTDTANKSLGNIRKLTEVSKLFGNRIYPLTYPKRYLEQEADTLSGNAIFTFNPEIEELEYLKEDPRKGKIKGYSVQFLVDSIGNVIPNETQITFSKTGMETYIPEQVPDISDFLNNRLIETKKTEIALERQAQKERQEYEQRLKAFDDECISSWDGSHIKLKKLIKENMNDPSSFEHVATYRMLKSGYAVIKMEYRGNNPYGAKILTQTTAKVNLEDCSVLEIVE